ncbi:MAG: hypothetical protein HY960_14875 [Ignavibacteriae bacterium]|nr:hypothetical protein [Ignavibacteriota bacterium]
MAITDLIELSVIATTEFPEIIRVVSIKEHKLRVVLIDESYIDFWWSEQVNGRYAHHWERRHVDGSIYRYDNAPHSPWKHLRSFPHHFHFKSDTDVRESDLNLAPVESVRQFLTFTSTIILK